MENYEINDETYVVMSSRVGETKIIEKEDEYDICCDAYKVMDESCKYYGSSYKGRLNAAKEILDCSYKLPILVEESTSLIFFPIKSSLADDCCWINLNSIKKVEKNGKKSRIILNNGKILEVDVSKMSIDNQIYRSTRFESIITKRKNAKKRI